jgi:hypothetical protein
VAVEPAHASNKTSWWSGAGQARQGGDQEPTCHCLSHVYTQSQNSAQGPPLRAHPPSMTHVSSIIDEMPQGTFWVRLRGRTDPMQGTKGQRATLLRIGKGNRGRARATETIHYTKAHPATAALVPVRLMGSDEHANCITPRSAHRALGATSEQGLSSGTLLTHTPVPTRHVSV